MPRITLPDGSKRQFDQAVSVMDVANDIGPGLAKATLAGKVDGRLVDQGIVHERGPIGDVRVALTVLIAIELKVASPWPVQP